MNPANDDILFTESKNLSDDADTTDKSVLKESASTTISALAKQGIFFVEKKEGDMKDEPHDELSQQLKDLGGIEIIPESEDEV